MSETPSTDPTSANNNSDKTLEEVPSSDKTASEKSVPVSDDSASNASDGSKKQSASGKPAPKPSGIRPPAPPSRIGRPCGGAHKPALPSTPTKSESLLIVAVLDLLECWLF